MINNIKGYWNTLKEVWKQAHKIPILLPFLIPIDIIIFGPLLLAGFLCTILISMSYSIYNLLKEMVLWLLGFWQCQICRNRFWIRSEYKYGKGHYRTISEGREYKKVCLACYSNHCNQFGKIPNRYL